MNEQKIDESFSESEEKKNISPLSKDISKDAEKITSKFKLSNEDPGSYLQYESQEDSLNVPKEESDNSEER